MKNLWVSIVGVMIIVILPGAVSAGFFDKKIVEDVGLDKKALKSEKESNSKDLLIAFIASAASVNKAQVLQSKAFELKKQAQELEAVGKMLASGSIDSSDQIEKVTETSVRANRVIQEKIQAGEKLNKQGRKYYIKSLLPYATGLLGLKKVISSSVGVQRDVTSKNWKKMSSGGVASTYIAKNSPEYFNSLYDSSSMMITYASENKLNIPSNAKNKLGELGGF